MSGDGLFTDPPDLNLLDLTVDPWVFAVEARKLAKAERGPFLPKWLGLVAKKDPLERDFLLAEGKDIWGYLIGTARKQLKDLTPARGETTRNAGASAW